jgi:hypothetical protein
MALAMKVVKINLIRETKIVVLWFAYDSMLSLLRDLGYIRRFTKVRRETTLRGQMGMHGVT